jgi:hypothetical protein
MNAFAEGRKTFFSSSLDMPCGYEKLAKLLAMDVDELVLDEDFVIDKFSGRLCSSIPRIVGKDIDIIVTTDVTVRINNKVLPEIFIHSQGVVEYLGGLNFKFNGNACRCVIAISKTSPITMIENISIKDIDVRNYPLEQQTYITGVSVSLSDNSDVDIRKISASNLYSSANNKIGDSCGNISALYVAGEKGIKADVDIYDCEFANMHNYNSKNKIVLEDTNGIYVCMQSPVSDHTKVHIHDITGVDYGKRLIKTDCSNILVEKIVASSKYHDTLSAVSLNNGDGNKYENAVIDNVHFKGTTQYVVGSAVPDTRISNVYSDIILEPSSFTAAILPMESCYVNNLFLSGAQQIASVTNTDQKVIIENVKYDDTMHPHRLYGSSLFLTRNANIDLSNIEIKSDKASFLFFDNYYEQTNYTTNVVAEINNINLDLYKSSKDWLLIMNGNNHIWDISITNSTIVFNAPVRGLIGVTPTIIDAPKMRLAMENVQVLYKDLYTDSTIPFGMVSFGKNTELELYNVNVYNKSGKAFSSGMYSLYATNLTDEITYDKLYISKCNIDECKNGKCGLYAKGKNIVWSGDEIITHSNPDSITSLSRGNRKFTYKDSLGQKYKWTGKKWKMVR